MVTLQAAINDVEQASTDLSNANTNQAAKQAKFDAAEADKTQADSDDAVAVRTFNSKLDQLIAAATAAKIPPPDGSTAPPPSIAITQAAG
jgi:hypothetical protein